MIATTSTTAASLRSELTRRGWQIMPFALASGDNEADTLAGILRLVEHASDDELQRIGGRLGWLIERVAYLAHVGGEC